MVCLCLLSRCFFFSSKVPVYNSGFSLTDPHSHNGQTQSWEFHFIASEPIQKSLRCYRPTSIPDTSLICLNVMNGMPHFSSIFLKYGSLQWLFCTIESGGEICHLLWKVACSACSLAGVVLVKGYGREGGREGKKTKLTASLCSNGWLSLNT